MAEGSATHLWTMRVIFVVLGLAILLLQLLPLETGPGGFAAPDVLLALCLAWSLRRPDYVPAVFVGLIVLLADLLFQRPPGLYAAIVVLACETIHKRGPALRDAGFAAEMITVFVAVFGVMLTYRIALAVMMLPLPPLGMSLIQSGLTVAIYPLVVFVSQITFGVRTQTTAELASRRSRA